MRKNKSIWIISPLTKLFMLSLLSAMFILMAGPGYAQAAVIMDCGSCGLELCALEEPAITSNPGDSKDSCPVAEITKDKYLKYYLDIYKLDSNIGSDRSEEGETLDDALIITVSRGEEELFQGPLENFEELVLGSLAGEEEQKFDIDIYLPGVKTGNGDQDTRITVGFWLRMDCWEDKCDIDHEEPGTAPGDDDKNGDDTDDDEILVGSEEPGLQPRNGTNILFQLFLVLMFLLIGIKAMDKKYI